MQVYVRLGIRLLYKVRHSLSTLLSPYTNHYAYFVGMEKSDRRRTRYVFFPPLPLPPLPSPSLCTPFPHELTFPHTSSPSLTNSPSLTPTPATDVT